jgi:hypothetical protein
MSCNIEPAKIAGEASSLRTGHALMTNRIEHALREIRNDLAIHPRVHGYYLVKMVELEAGWQSDEEAALTGAFECLDDREWPVPELRPADQRWTDYEVAERVAEERAIDALVGGASIGHTRETIARTQATEIWRRFRGLFSPTARFFVGVGLGNSSFVSSDGAIVVDEARAGCLCIIESD